MISPNPPWPVTLSLFYRNRPLNPKVRHAVSSLLGVMAAEAPYRVPAQLDFSLVESLLSTKASAAEYHEWALREDLDYFSRTLQAAKDHCQDTLNDLDRNTHSLMNRDRSGLWAHIIGSVKSHSVPKET